MAYLAQDDRPDMQAHVHPQRRVEFNREVAVEAIERLGHDAHGGECCARPAARVAAQPEQGHDASPMNLSTRPPAASITSPIARALVGKSEGDEVDVAVPGGTRTYEIVSVSYA